jgi:hypothetical protein
MGKEEKVKIERYIDFSKVIPESKITGDDQEEAIELSNMLREAKAYILSFDWCRDIEEAYLGIGFSGIISIFLFKLCPAKAKVDEWLWVVVGDVPPAYISVINAPNPATALDAYIGAMEDWVKAVRAGDSVDSLIPVNVPPNLEWANKLESRLKFLDSKILTMYKDDLKREGK